MPVPLRIAILISGRGSNMQMLVHTAKSLGVDISLVASDRQAAGIEWAKADGLPTAIFAPKDLGGRRPFQEDILAKTLLASKSDYIFLAGYMAILSASFIDKFSHKIINIHPSLLPKYKGLDTHQRAIDAGETTHGASVHLVTPELDGGPIILQGVVDVNPEDTADQLAERTLAVEHLLYPEILGALAKGHLTTNEGQVRWRETALEALLANHQNLRFED